MSERTSLEGLLGDWIRSEAPARADSAVLAGALDRIGKLEQRRPLARFISMASRPSRWLRLSLVAAVLTVAVLGAALMVGAPPSDPVTPSVMPSVVPSVAPSLVPSVVPSVAPSVVPSVVPAGATVTNGWIAYAAQGERKGTSTGDGIPDSTTDWDIYITRPGVEARRIVGDDVELLQQTCPSFSPDGAWLAYSEDGTLVLTSLDEAGGLAGEQIRVPRVGCVVWAPDGRHLAEHGDGFLSVLSFDGTTIRHEGVIATGDIGGFSWAPDGTRLAVIQTPDGWATPGLGVLSIVALDGTRTELLGTDDFGGEDEGLVSAVDWSPDGRRLMIGRSTLLGSSSIWVMDADGTGLRRMAGDHDQALSGMGPPVWSPDGRRVAANNLAGQIAILDVDDPTRVDRIAADVASEMWWSPDGAYLLYVGGDGDRNGYYAPDWAVTIVAVDGTSDPVQVTPWTNGLYWADKEQLDWQAVPVEP